MLYALITFRRIPPGVITVGRIVPRSLAVGGLWWPGVPIARVVWLIILIVHEVAITRLDQLAGGLLLPHKRMVVLIPVLVQ
jgi:hypothetical protein